MPPQPETVFPIPVVTEDYHSHPQMPSFISDLFKELASVNNKLAQHDGKIKEFEALLAENTELKSTLARANSRIALLEDQLNKRTVVQDLEMENTSPTMLDTELPASVHGTEASRHAPSAADPIVPRPERVVSTYASIASSNKTPRRRMTAAAKQSIARTFLPVSTTQGFQYIYIFARGKEPISTMRSKLRKLGLHSGRILDIHYPDNQVMAMLIHNDYVPTVTETLHKFGIKLNTDFNPLSPLGLRDPQYSTLTNEQRVLKITEIHQNRLIIAVKRTTSVPCQTALARDFLNKKWITEIQFSSLMDTIKPSRYTNDPGNTAESADSTMADVVNTFRPSSPISSQAAGDIAAPTD